MKKRINLNEHMLQHIICEAVKKVVGNELEEQDLNRYIKKSHIRMLEKFKQDLEEFRQRTVEDVAVLWEDVDMPVTLGNIRLENGYLVYEYDGIEYSDQIVDQYIDTKEYFEIEYQGIADIIREWRTWLRRAKRYWEMDPDKLDVIQSGEKEDEDDGEDEILREQGIEPPIPLSSQQIKQMKKELKKI